MGTRVRGLVASLVLGGTLALSACGGEGSDAREAAVEWAGYVDAGSEAACDLSTERGGWALAARTGGLECEEYAKRLEFLPDAFLLDSTAGLAEGLDDADVAEATDADGEQIQRVSFEPRDSVTIEVDLVEQDGKWLVNDFRAESDPLSGPGSEAIDEAAIDGLDQSDPDAVRVRWAELVADRDPSACLLADPAGIYSQIARAPDIDSCAELVTSGLLVYGPARRLVDGAEVAQFAGEPKDPLNPGAKLSRYTAQLDDGRRYTFNLALVDGSWRMRSLSSGCVSSVPADPFSCG